MGAKYNLQAVKAKYLESHPTIPEYIEFTLDGGKDATVFRIHSPLFQTNKEKRAFAKAQESGDEFELAKALLGDQWADFDAQGGQVSDLILLMNQVGADMTETDDEGNPTRR